MVAFTKSYLKKRAGILDESQLFTKLRLVIPPLWNRLDRALFTEFSNVFPAIAEHLSEYCFGVFA
jgi:hypothetical protein